MRIISGKKRGKKLKLPTTVDIRPTTDKVKESVFNAVQFDILNSVFLDLFAGTGQIGIEALSRGAKCAIFVDISKISIDLINENLKLSNLQNCSEILNLDAMSFLNRRNFEFNIAFLDPPFKSGLLQKVLPLVAKLIDRNGIIICEHSSKEVLPEKIESFTLKKNYKYGSIIISIYKI